MKRTLVRCVSAVLFVAAAGLAAQPGAVTAREETLVLPTYPAAPPDPAPVFYEGRTYQGAKGAIYPYPIQDRLSSQRVDKPYRIVWLENEYLRIGVVPELGGRIFEGLDKTNGYHFFYRQHVVKPALIGMLGAWISGGVEWNIPHHHRASSFMPLSHKLEESPDGSRTVWIGEFELRHRMRWVMGLTLHPGKAYLEATLRLFNGTPLTHSFLYFANVAVHTNDRYQVIFPPSTRLATQHSKVEFSDWPISRQEYGGADFRAGVDVSWWKAHKEPRSMFAFESEEDFLAGYDHGKQAGTLHVAEHGIMPGKKFFTWGTGSEGQAWDRALSDTDGPYLELMVGGYSDNQPDYSWIQPHEVKTVKEFWYPFRGIGGVKNANLLAAVNLDVVSGRIKAGFDTTAAYERARILIEGAGRPLLDETVSVAPGKPALRDVALPSGMRPQDVRASLWIDGKQAISYAVPPPTDRTTIPPPAVPPAAPEKIKTNEELYLAGLRLEQFYNPAQEPDPYYLEALKRDPSDARANTAMALLHLRRGEFALAEGRLRAAVGRITGNYTRARDGEPHYYLGIALTEQEKFAEAREQFSRAAWDNGWHTAANYQLALLSCRERDFEQALRYADRALTTASESTRALVLKAAILRHLDRAGEALPLLTKAAQLDPVDPWPAVERSLAAGAPVIEPGDGQAYFEAAVEYARGGLWKDAVSVLNGVVRREPDARRVPPMLLYWLASLQQRDGAEAQSLETLRLASTMPSEFAFPFRTEAIAVLREAIRRQPNDAAAHYYLGNLLYDLQPAAAMEAWEASAKLNPKFAMVHRNLALAYARRQREDRKAVPAMEAALRLEANPRFLLELDLLYERVGASAAKRLAAFDAAGSVSRKRDDTLAREIAVRILAGQYDRAIELLRGNTFHIWEGASITVHGSWVDAFLLRGHGRLKAGRAAEALEDYRRALEYPDNLGEGRSSGNDRTAAIEYYIAAAHKALGQPGEAAAALQRAVAAGAGSRDPEVAYHRALALKETGRAAEAAQATEQLAAIGRELLQGGAADHFAKFGDSRPDAAVQADGHYVLGLAHLSAGETARAAAEFRKALEANPSHLWARYHCSDCRGVAVSGM